VLDKALFIRQLQLLGVQPGMQLLVHSSLRKLGAVVGGADSIIDSLLEILGPEGTLMMSTVSGNVNREQPVFHVEHTPSTVGTLSNVFRKRPGALRSLHPVHSIAALGARAEFFCEGHLQARTAWSEDSPYGKLMRQDGHILFLGTNFSANTCMHALEIEAKVPGLHTPESSTLYVCDYDNRWHQIEHHWHAPKKDSYVDMEQVVEKAGALKYGVLGKSISRLVQAGKMRERLLPIFLHTPELAIRKLSDSEFIWE
jgi:aminoglycoside 3-N-acetyltransferase